MMLKGWQIYIWIYPTCILLSHCEVSMVANLHHSGVMISTVVTLLCAVYITGQVIKPAPSLWASFTDQLKKIYLSKVRGISFLLTIPQFVSNLVFFFFHQFKGIDLKEMAACTLLFEGTAEVSKKYLFAILL